MIKIINWKTQDIIYKGDYKSIKEALEDGIKQKISFNYAELNYAKLNNAELNNAELNYAELNDAELNDAKLNNAKLNNAKLNNAELNNAELNDAELNDAKLNNAELNNAELNYAKLNNAKLNNAELNYAKLNYAEFNYAELNDAKLNNAKLNTAELNYAKLNNAKLNNAKLNYAELNNAKGLLNQKLWLLENFKKIKDGIVVYKGIGNTVYSTPDYWKIRSGNYLIEEVNYNRTTMCGCGINFGTKKFIRNNYPKAVIWECLIEWEDLINVVVPYNTDGKARCARLKLLNIIEE